MEFSLQTIRTVSRNQTGQKIIKLNMFRAAADQTEASVSLIPTGRLPLPPPLTEELNVIVLENETLIFTACKEFSECKEMKSRLFEAGLVRFKTVFKGSI